VTAKWEPVPGEAGFGWSDLTDRGKIVALALLTIVLLIGAFAPWDRLPWNQVTCPAGQTLELDDQGHPARCVTP
jgi:hypothetical protein